MQNRRTCGKVIVEQWQATDNGICVGENEQEKGYSLQCTRTNGRVLFVQDRNCYGPGINWNEADLYDEDSAVLDNTMAGKGYYLHCRQLDRNPEQDQSEQLIRNRKVREG